MDTMPVEKWLREQADAALKSRDFGLCNNLNLAAGYVEFLQRELADAKGAISHLRAAGFEDADIMDQMETDAALARAEASS